MRRSESEAIFGRIDGGGGASVGRFWQVIEPRSTKSELLESAPLRDVTLVAKWGVEPSWDSVVSGPSGSQKDRGCLSAAELPGIGAGKPAAETEPRRGLSARGCHKP